MGWFDRTLTDEEILENKIREFVENIEFKISYGATLEILESGRTYNIGDNIKIYIDIYNSSRVYKCRISYKEIELYYFYGGEQKVVNDFALEIGNLFLEKLSKYKISFEKLEKEKNDRIKKEREEKEKIIRDVNIQEALAEILLIDMPKPSKEVVDEFAEVFQDTRRIVELAQEMTTIKKKYITI